jgi:hypothetical protein
MVNTVQQEVQGQEGWVVWQPLVDVEQEPMQTIL